MRLIVTGAEGFVGGHLLPHLLRRGHQVTGTYLAAHPDIEGVAWIQTDLISPQSVSALVNAAQPDGVIHLAAISHVPAVQADPGRAFAANVTGLVHLLSACTGSAETVVIVSTGEVYGSVSPQRLPICEGEPIAPRNLYGVTKACSEQVARYFGRIGGLHPTVVRPFSQMGPGQPDTFVTSSFARQIARIALGKSPPRVRVGNLTVRRDFMDVRDVVSAYTMLAESHAGQGPFNVCTGRSVSIGHILDTLIALSGHEIQVQVDPARIRPTDIENMVGDPSAFYQATGWEPTLSIEQSLRDILQFWLTREGGG
ncbi:GDP-mannose 4,6-dehydratase [Candidatus Fermentibacteria bacterium]|nr:GDP-mannose 4,6-dehydratase [Candidatus Fermentibacteria bacterium]